MSDVISLDLQSRDTLGKAVKQLRKDGFVPAVVHDHGKPSVIVMGDYMQMLKTYHKAGKHHPVEVTASGKKYTAIIKDATFEPRNNTLTHLVFNAVNRNEVVEAEIPIKPKFADENESFPAERASLIVLTHLEAVAVKATPANLPDVLQYDAEKLVEVGDHVSVSDLIVPPNVSVEADQDASIASVYEPSALAAANDAAGGDDEDASAEVPSDNGSAATDDQTSQAEEDQPGGRKQFEGHEDKADNN